jgi:hypothetical protein
MPDSGVDMVYEYPYKMPAKTAIIGSINIYIDISFGHLFCYIVYHKYEVFLRMWKKGEKVAPHIYAELFN